MIQTLGCLEETVYMVGRTTRLTHMYLMSVWGSLTLAQYPTRVVIFSLRIA